MGLRFFVFFREPMNWNEKLKKKKKKNNRDRAPHKTSISISKLFSITKGWLDFRCWWCSGLFFAIDPTDSTKP